jgi:outer membrane protein, heavy metal efflux system
MRIRADRTIALTLLTTLAGASASAARAAPGAGADEADEATLARAARLEVVLRLALARNADIAESRSRVEASRARADAAGRLPDPELKGELWGVPIASPVSFGRADTIMVGVRESFPALGTRAAERRMADEEAAAVREGERARARELTARVRRAFAEYVRAEHEARIHREHTGILSRLMELTRAHYQSGRGSQQELLRLSLGLSRLHAAVADVEQQLRSARFVLNTLMGREPDAELGPPPEPMTDGKASAPVRDPADAALDRPELAAAARAVRRGEAAVDLAARRARWPRLMIGADYWYMPMLHEPHGYGAMVAVSLPWLNPEHDARVREAEHTLAAERRALESQRRVAAFEVVDARAKVEAARQALAILDASVLPEARRAFEAAQAAYGAGQGSALLVLDALQTYLDVRLERTRAVVRLETSRSDYDRAAGVEITQ